MTYLKVHTPKKNSILRKNKYNGFNRLDLFFKNHLIIFKRFKF